MYTKNYTNKKQLQQKIKSVLTNINLCLTYKKDKRKIYLGNTNNFIYKDVNDSNSNLIPECYYVNYIDKDNIITFGHSHTEWSETPEKLQPLLIKLNLNDCLICQKGKIKINGIETIFYKNKKGILVLL